MKLIARHLAGVFRRAPYHHGLRSQGKLIMGPQWIIKLTILGHARLLFLLVAMRRTASFPNREPWGGKDKAL